MNYSEVGFSFIASVFGVESETIKWIVAAVGFIVAFCIFALGSRCESCGKLFSTVETGSEILDQKIMQGIKKSKYKNGNTRTLKAIYEVTKVKVFKECANCVFKSTEIQTDKKEI